MWVNPDGREMSDEEWRNSFARCLGVYLAGDGLDERDVQGRRLHDENFLVLFNAHHEEIRFTTPDYRAGAAWEVLLDTHFATGLPGVARIAAGSAYRLQGRSVVLLMLPAKAATPALKEAVIQSDVDQPAEASTDTAMSQ